MGVILLIFFLVEPSKQFSIPVHQTLGDNHSEPVSSGESVTERKTEGKTAVISTTDGSKIINSTEQTNGTVGLHNQSKRKLPNKFHFFCVNDCLTYRCTCNSCDEITKLPDPCIDMKQKCKEVAKGPGILCQQTLDLCFKNGTKVCTRLPLRNSECIETSTTKYTSTQVPSTTIESHEVYEPTGSTYHYNSDNKEASEGVSTMKYISTQVPSTRTGSTDHSDSKDASKGVSRGIVVRVVVILMVVIITVLSILLCRRKCSGRRSSLKSPHDQTLTADIRTVDSGRVGNRITESDLTHQRQNYTSYRPEENEYMQLHLPDGYRPAGDDSSPSVDYIAQESQIISRCLESSIKPQTTSDSTYDDHEYSYPDDPVLAQCRQVPERCLLKPEEHFVARQDYDVLQDSEITDQTAEYNKLQNVCATPNQPDRKDVYMHLRRLQQPVNVNGDESKILNTNINNATEESHAVAQSFAPIDGFQAKDYRYQATTADDTNDENEYLYPYDYLPAQVQVPDAQHFVEGDDYNVLHVNNDREIIYDGRIVTHESNEHEDQQTTSPLPNFADGVHDGIHNGASLTQSESDEV